MSDHAVLRAGSLSLTRARSSDSAELISLQRAAYARNRELLGVEPLPLLADYATVMRDMEVWLARAGDRITGAIILQPRSDDLLVWSVATHPAVQGAGLGKAMLCAAETRARDLGLPCMRLYTGTLLKHLVEWYARRGYAIERVEALSDRSITHMIKHLSTPAEAAP